MPTTLNPWFLLGLLAAFIGIGGEGYYQGHAHGVQAQRLADADAMQKVRNEVAANKEEAAKQLIASADSVNQVMADREAVKTQLYQEHQSHVQTTDRLHDLLSVDGLRFQSEAARSGSGSGGQVSTKGNAAGDNGTSFCIVSDATAIALKSIAYDADKLADDYRLLFEWAHALNVK